ncbi:PEP-CTERM sorting domain-containing protein [Aquabacterium sp. CECT 9606]
MGYRVPAVPEPGTFALMGLAPLFGCAWKAEVK